MLKNKISSLLMLSAGLFGCSSESPLVPSEGGAGAPAAKLSVAVGRAGGMATSECPMMHFTGAEVDKEGRAGGLSVLRRSANQVSTVINASDLEPDAAVTLWWVVFNNPEACEDGCNDEDFGNPAVMASVLYGAGEMTDSQGQATFKAVLPEGPTGAQVPFGLAGDRVGLVDAQSAEIHQVLRTHGAPLSGSTLEEQLTTFNGGCGSVGAPDVMGDACIDLQFAVHLADERGLSKPKVADLIHFTGTEVAAQGPAGGVSKLWRTRDYVATKIYATDLEPDAAVTLWWVIFNNPEACQDGCNDEDFGNPAVLASVVYGDGAVTNIQGQATFKAVLSEGASIAQAPFGLPGDGVGLIDAQSAEIHQVLRTHGAPLGGVLLEEQLNTFNGGCGSVGAPDVAGDACVDLQFSVHLP